MTKNDLPLFLGAIIISVVLPKLMGWLFPRLLKLLKKEITPRLENTLELLTSGIFSLVLGGFVLFNPPAMKLRCQLPFNILQNFILKGLGVRDFFFLTNCLSFLRK